MKRLLLFIGLLPLLMQAQTTIYTNDMAYVIGDVKQAFIKNKITEPSQVQALLEGFKTMQVNGIRIPIFAKDTEPNEQALVYFYTQAYKAGFDLFANPVHWSGGQRVANGVFEDFEENFGGPVKNDPKKTQALIDRILEIDNLYPNLKWVNPFNEDGSPGGAWSAAQMTEIYKTLSEELENAELIGACPWGIPAGIKIIKNTDVEKYVTVSTTHNLGFNHSSWEEFIQLSHDAGLPAWDSEVNHNVRTDLDPTGTTRLEAAIQYGVDGMVFYDSWKVIDLTTGEVNSTGQVWMSHYLKPASLDNNIENKTDLFDVYSGKSSFQIRLIEPFIQNAIQVVDMSGKLIRQMTVNNTQDIEIDNVKAGIYVVLLSTNGQLQREKVVVY